MSPLVGVLVTVFLLGVNAFFVTGEFATTSSRRSQIEPLYEQGRRGSAKAMYALQHVSLMLAICQLGITVASTSLGVVAEPAIAHLVEGPLVHLGLPAATSHVVGFTAALVIVLFLHVVFGEMVPKNIAIANPHRALLVLAPPLVGVGPRQRPRKAAEGPPAPRVLKGPRQHP
ncbi:MAG: CNNM domain-containing protein, partial [Actinomyces sp.]|nr:CNNM domain-containing protein [Actinomyces sp.]